VENPSIVWRCPRSDEILEGLENSHFTVKKRDLMGRIFSRVERGRLGKNFGIVPVRPPQGGNVPKRSNQVETYFLLLVKKGA